MKNEVGPTLTHLALGLAKICGIQSDVYDDEDDCIIEFRENIRKDFYGEIVRESRPHSMYSAIDQFRNIIEEHEFKISSTFHEKRMAAYINNDDIDIPGEETIKEFSLKDRI